MFLWDPRTVLGFGKRALAKACRRETGDSGIAFNHVNAALISNGGLVDPDGYCDHVMADVEELQVLGRQQPNVQHYNEYHAADHASLDFPDIQRQYINAFNPGIQQSAFHDPSSFQQPKLGGYGHSQASIKGHPGEHGDIPLPYGNKPGHMSFPGEENVNTMDVDDSSRVSSGVPCVGNLKRRASPDAEEVNVGWGAKMPRTWGGMHDKRIVSIFTLGLREANKARVAAWKRISEGMNITLPEHPAFSLEPECTPQPLTMGCFGGETGGICQTWNISYQSFTGEMQVFGTELSVLTNSNGIQWGSAKIPAICMHIFDYLNAHNAFEKEGIFRLAGAEFRSRAILRDINAGHYNGGFASLNGKTIDKGGCVAPDGQPNMDLPILEMAGLLKQFLRDLPEPLIPPYLSTIGRLIVERHDPRRYDHTLALLRDMIILLPDESRAMLAFLLDVGKRTVKSSHINLMTSENVARVIAPNLIKIDLLMARAAGNNSKGRLAVSAAGLDAFDWVIHWFKLCLENVHVRADMRVPITEDCGSEGSAFFSIEALEGSQQFTEEGAAGHQESLGPPQKKPRFQQKWKKAWKRGKHS